MAINFKETIETSPWNKYGEEVGDVSTADGTIKSADAVAVARDYHEWLESKNPEVGACILCERRFKTRKKKECRERF